MAEPPGDEDSPKGVKSFLATSPGGSIARPKSASSRRGANFRALIRGRVAAYALVIGCATGFLAGAYLGSPAAMVGLPLAVVAVVLLVCLWAADRRAEREFFEAFAAGRGWTYWERTELHPLTPLLGAGDRRHCEHSMKGLLDRTSGPPCLVAHYTYEVEREHSGSAGDTVRGWEPHHFTICVVEDEAAMGMFRGVYLRPKRGVFESLAGHDWLRGHDLREVELESSRFCERYDLRIVEDQDEGRLRELFDPKFIVWLAEHPLAPGIEFRAGTLVVYLGGHEESEGRLVWLIDATREIAERIRSEAGEATER